MIVRKRKALPITLIMMTSSFFFACGKSHDVSISRVKPPVQEAAGTAMAGTALMYSLAEFQPQTTNLQQDLKSRFFSDGPTNLMSILASVDDRLSVIESQAKSGGKCLDNSAVEKTLTLFGESVTFNFQCYQKISPDGIIAFGKKDSTWSIYVMVGAGPIAAKATDLGSGKTEVEIWGAVGTTNVPTWDAMSYTGFHIKANNQTGAIEMTAGGIGIGFCGVTLKGDGTNMYVTGSVDSGATCGSVVNSCVLMSDLTSSGTCTAISDSSFGLTKLGRAQATSSGASGNIPATWGGSTYPASGATLTLDGSSTDMIHFGITSASDLPSGVTDIAQ